MRLNGNKEETLFDGSNWNDWENMMINELRSKGLYQVVSKDKRKEIKELKDEQLKLEKLEQWELDNDKALGKICLALDYKYMEQVRRFSTAYEVWHYLENLQRTSSMHTIYLTRQTFSNLTMKDNDDVMVVISKLERCYRLLENTMSKISEGELIHRLLHVLPSTWKIFVEQKSLDTRCLTHYEILKTAVIEEDIRRKGSISLNNETKNTEAAQVLNVSGYNQQQHSNRHKLICNKCNKPGHKATNCGLKCFSCGKLGHKASNCWSKSTGKKYTNNQDSRQHANHASNNQYGNQYVLTVTDKSTKGELMCILDSGATNHIFKDKIHFTNYTCSNMMSKVYTANGEGLIVHGSGDVLLFDKNVNEEVLLTRVLHVPEIEKNLISLPQIDKKGYRIVFNDKIVKIMQSNKSIMTASLENNLYILNVDIQRHEANVTKYIEKDTLKNWHERLCHFNIEYIKKLPEIAGNIEITDRNFEKCETCEINKMTRKGFNSNFKKDTIVGRSFNADIGFINKPGINNESCFVIYTDQATGCCVLYCLQNKGQQTEIFKHFVNSMRTQYNYTVGYLYTDNGVEFKNNQMTEFCTSKGIKQVFTTAYSPEQNGIAERQNRTVVEAVRIMINTTKLDKSFWPYAINYAIYIKNRVTPNRNGGDKTAYESFTSKKPNIGKIRQFGERCLVYIDKVKRDKLDEKAKEAYLLGIEENGYILLDIASNKIIKSVHVSFSNSWSKDSNNVNTPAYISESESSESESEKESNKSKEHKIDKKKKVTFYYQDKSVKAAKDINLKIDEDNIIQNRLRSANTVSSKEEPQSYREAMLSEDAEKWREAIDSELTSLQENETFSEPIKIKELPADVNLISTKWVFKIKVDVNGEIDKFKGRLVGRGFSQQEGIDYNSDELFAPVTRIETIRTLFKISLENNMKITQMDIVTAYLYADMDKDLYVSIPEGYANYDTIKDQYALKLLKGLYGIKQSGKLWNTHITNSLKAIGFNLSINDPCLFFLKRGDIIAYLTIYVDDILLSTNNEELRTEVEVFLSETYKVKQLGKLTGILRIKVLYTENSITMDLDQQTKNILTKYLEDANHFSKVPMEESLNLAKGGNAVKLPFRHVLGSLLHLSNKVRPDITYATAYLARFADSYDKIHWQHIQRLLAYINYTNNYKLSYFKEKENHTLNLVAYADASFASDKECPVSTSGYLIYLGNSLISWRSCKQKTTALSTAEAEVDALVTCVRELVWLNNLLKEMKIKTKEPITIYEDNKSCIDMIKKPAPSARNRHIATKIHFLYELIQEKTIEVTYCPTSEMLADGLTKALPLNKFREFRKQVNICNGGVLNLADANTN
jgi:transposase InsO family protein